MDKNSDHIDEKVLFRFLLGEASEEEIEQVKVWLQQSKLNQKILDDYEAIWAEAGKLTPNPVAVDTPYAWKEMSQRVDRFENEKKSSKLISFNSKSIWISSGIAAAVVLIFGIYQLIYQPGVHKQNILISSHKEILHDTLPDGTQIAINENTSIKYPGQFAQNERRIKLEGEAYFKVEHNVEKPFIIETEHAFIQVLGTSFNVKAYENSELEVIVTDGLVKLFILDEESMDTSAILLKAGETGRISVEDRKPVYIAEQIPDAIFWMDYTLIFNDTGLKNVFKLLEDYYTVEIKVDNKQIYDCNLSTTFSNNSIDDIIEVIAATFELKYTKENNIFTLKGDGCTKESL